MTPEQYEKLMKLPPKLRSGDVTYASGTSLPQLMGWLEHENVYLDAEAERSGKVQHRSYSVLDAIRIALISRLLAHGVANPKEASRLVETMLRTLVGTPGKAIAARKSLPEAPIEDYLVNLVLSTLYDSAMLVWFDKEKDKWTFACVHQHIGWLLSGEPSVESTDTFTVIKLHRIVEAVLGRIFEIQKEKI